MKFASATLSGAYLIDIERHGDERGFFSRVFCQKEFSSAGLESNFVQVNNSLSTHKGTLRGLHYQLVPAAEAKLIRCMRGAVFDVIADLRPDSPTYCRWFGAELTEENRRMMFVPPGLAHGILTLTPNTELLYIASEFYTPEFERGVRWDDPAISIQWPFEPSEISTKDRTWPNLDSTFHGVDKFRGLL